MAIRELINVFPFNYSVAKDTTFYAGMVLARGTDGNVLKADRTDTTHQLSQSIVGLSADDKAATGVTFIQADPVGSTYVDGSGVVQAANNGWFVGAKRGLADNAAFDETVTGVTDLTSPGSSGYQGPRRGVGVFQAPGQFVTDQFALFQTNDATTSSIDDSAISTFAVNDLLTYGASGSGNAGAGKLVKVVSGSNQGAVVAKVDRYDSAAGLLYITLL